MNPQFFRSFPLIHPATLHPLPQRRGSRASLRRSSDVCRHERKSKQLPYESQDRTGKKVSQSPTARVLQNCPTSRMPARVSVKALRLLKENIHTLLHRRNENQVTLARWVGHSKSWMNKFLNDQTDRTELQLHDLDRIADFFGIEAYQLFMPGISHLTERRKDVERRAGGDRRLGHQGRHLATLRSELNKLPSLASAHAPTKVPSTPSSALPEQVRRILADADEAIHAFYIGQQTAIPGDGVAKRASGDRRARRPHARPAK